MSEEVQSVLKRRFKWAQVIAAIAVLIGTVTLHRYATANGISVDDCKAYELYAARHLAATVKALPGSYFTCQPLPGYPALLALVSKIRNIEPVRAAPGLDAGMLVLMFAGFIIVSMRRPRSLPGILLSTSALACLTLRLAWIQSPFLLVFSAVPWVLMGLDRDRPASPTVRNLTLGAALVVLALLTSRLATLGLLFFVVISAILLRVGTMIRRARSIKPGEAVTMPLLPPRFLTACAGIIIVAVCLLVVEARKMRTAPHRYGVAAWRDSKTIRLLRLLPEATTVYTNDPNALTVLVDNPGEDLPAKWDDRAKRWDVFDVRSGKSPSGVTAQEVAADIARNHAVIAYFTADGAVPPPEEALTPYLSPGRWIDLPDAKFFAANADADVRDALAKIHPEGFRADAAWTPARRSAGHDTAWLARHEEFCKIAVKGDIGLLFLGDSITDDVRQEEKTPGGTALFNERFGKYKPANFGIDHDKTQHLLFRILDGECPPTIHPKVAVMLIGTNNTGEDSPEAIAKGVRACLDAVRKHLPATKVILMGEIPRSAHADSEKRAILKRVNAIISTYADGKTVRYVDIYDRFLEPNGDLGDGMRQDDHLHPTLKGYHIWFDAIGPLIEEMMREE